MKKTLFCIFTFCLLLGQVWAANKEPEATNTFSTGETIELPAGTFGSRTRVFAKKLKPNENPVNSGRWITVSDTKVFAVFYDKETVEKHFISTNPASTNGRPPVIYNVWLKYFTNVDGERIVTNGHQHEVNCLNRTIDGEMITPESGKEEIYNYFCRSQDALKTVAPLTPEQLQQKAVTDGFNAAQAEQNKQRQAQILQQIPSQAASLLYLFRK